MGHFALVTNNVVQYVICIDNNDMDNLPFPESEPLGQAFIAALPGYNTLTGTWVQCSFNANFRGVYPGSGMLFDGTNFSFPPKPASPPVVVTE